MTSGNNWLPDLSPNAEIKIRKREKIYYSHHPPAHVFLLFIDKRLGNSEGMSYSFLHYSSFDQYICNIFTKIACENWVSYLDTSAACTCERKQSYIL